MSDFCQHWDARLIRTLAYNVYSLSLGVGNQNMADAFKWLSDPQPKDLVVEISTMRRRERDFEAVGRLVRKALEPMGNGSGFSETVWYVELEDARIYRWVNADFIRAPESISPWREAVRKGKEAKP